MKAYCFRSFFPIILFSWFCIGPFPSQATSSINQQADDWVRSFIFTPNGSARISEYDIQCITNLIYFSWCRSAITLKAQDEALKTIETVWKGWQNIAQARLDPSIDLPYVIRQGQQEETITKFWKYGELHHSIGMIYGYAVKMILDKQILQTPLALDAVATMRAHARTVVLEALCDIRKQLGEFFQLKTKNNNDLLHSLLIDAEYQREDCKKGINLLDYISSYIPQLALNSFVQANSTNTLVSEEGWHALKTIQEIGNQTWKSIEDARTEFYQAYYSALLDAINKYGISPSVLLCMFNEQGIIPAHEQQQYLPNPAQLALQYIYNIF